MPWTKRINGRSRASGDVRWGLGVGPVDTGDWLIFGDTMEMGAAFKCNHHACGSFAEVTSVVGVELSWSKWREKWHPTYLLHTAEGKLPVMWARLTYHWRPFPTHIRCRAFRGTIETEWEGQRPSFLGSVTYWLLSVFGVPDPYRQYEALRNVDGNEIIALYRVLRSDSFENWCAEITARDNVCQMRLQHLPPRLKVLHTGDRIVALDGNGEVITAEVFRWRPERGRITVHRAIEGVEAILAFLFLQACEMERDTLD